jgi:hypothetical protein
VPPDDRLRRDDDGGFLPSGPGPASQDPEELVAESETGARVSPLQHGELLSRQKILTSQIATVTPEAEERSRP